MKVYIVNWFDAERYSDCSGVHSVHSSRDAAQNLIDEKGIGPHSSSVFNDEYFLSYDIEEYEVIA